MTVTVGKTSKGKESKALPYLVRICVLGGRRAGKTALVSRFLDDAFPEEYHASNLSTRTKTVTVAGRQYDAEITDSPDYMIFIKSMPGIERQTYLNNDGFVLVYSISSRQSFEVALLAHHRILQVRKDCPIMLVGTRADIHNKLPREVTKEEAMTSLTGDWLTVVETTATRALSNHVFGELIAKIATYPDFVLFPNDPKARKGVGKSPHVYPATIKPLQGALKARAESLSSLPSMADINAMVVEASSLDQASGPIATDLNGDSKSLKLSKSNPKLNTALFYQNEMEKRLAYAVARLEGRPQHNGEAAKPMAVQRAQSTWDGRKWQTLSTGDRVCLHGLPRASKSCRAPTRPYLNITGLAKSTSFPELSSLANEWGMSRSPRPTTGRPFSDGLYINGRQSRDSMLDSLSLPPLDESDDRQTTESRSPTDLHNNTQPISSLKHVSHTPPCHDQRPANLVKSHMRTASSPVQACAIANQHASHYRNIKTLEKSAANKDQVEMAARHLLNITMDQKLEELPCFHPTNSSQSREERRLLIHNLLSNQTDGAWLLRHNGANYVVSMCYKGSVKHLVVLEKSGQYTFCDDFFPSVAQLLAHYHTNVLSATNLPVVLGQRVPCLALECVSTSANGLT